MRKRFLLLSACALILVMGVSFLFYFFSERENGSEQKGENAVMANEAAKLLEEGKTEEASEKLKILISDISVHEEKERRDPRILVIGGISGGMLLLAFLYMYISVIRPLNKIKNRAAEIAKGDLDTPLLLDRGSAVGEFSWAIDSMRKEIKKARASEAEAVENNKTVIATLSHDIKTPIASIRAYAEGLGANLDSTPEKRAAYVDVIMKKSDEVSKVTDDLLLHSLSDMRRLKVENRKMEIWSFVEGAVKDLDPDGKEIKILGQPFKAEVMADPDRLLQCLENLINNARKYAGTSIEVSVAREEPGRVVISVRDHGEGIPNEDMPFIFDKFYRGHNHGPKPGSGLGLYIVKYLMEQMNGEVTLENLSDGLLARLILPESGE